ncbi:MAG: hypothetical protein LBD79_07205, partial [Treponema sp.]|nr:hypothetical protein [Treponema sp.]
MKRLIAISSLLALVMAGNSLFAFDILDSEGEKSGFSLDMNAKFQFDIITDDSKTYDKEKTWIEENESDKQAKVSFGVKYDGDNYAFGLGAGFRKKFASDSEEKEWYLDDAWGKYFLLDKQLWIRGGSMDGLWRIDTDPLNKNYGGDNGPGVQINFASSAVTGLNVGVALPIPRGSSRVITAAVPEKWTPVPGEDGKFTYTPAVSATIGNWGPTYPFTNMAFGLRLNGTIPNLDLGAELDLLGNEPTNNKSGADEGEGDFKGMNFHLTAVYTFAPVTLKAALLTEGLANGKSNAPDPVTEFGVRVIFDIPNAEGSSLDLGDPWVQFQMLRNANGYGSTTKETKSFEDMDIQFEWEPSYSLVPDQLKALLWFKVAYRSWKEPTSDQEKYPIDFAVRPKLEFKFAPNATLSIHDEVYFV